MLKSVLRVETHIYLVKYPYELARNDYELGCSEVLATENCHKMIPVMWGWFPYTLQGGRVSYKALRASVPSQNAVYSSFIFSSDSIDREQNRRLENVEKRLSQTPQMDFLRWLEVATGSQAFRKPQ